MPSLAMLQECHYNDEAVFGELLQTAATRLLVMDARVDYGSDRSDDRSLNSRLADSRAGYQMPREGAFELDVLASGAQVDTATGALAHTSVTRLVADGLGGGDISQVGGLAGAAPTTTTAAAATGTRARGGVIMVGAKKDTRGDGQPWLVGNPNTTFLNALAFAPAAADVLRACIMCYPTETLGPTKRFICGFSNNPGAQYAMHGCQLDRADLKVTHGDLPYWTLRYQYANWRDLTGFTVPSGVAPGDNKSAISAAASYQLQLVGTSTRNAVAATELEIRLNTGLIASRGQGGQTALQSIIGWTRTKTSNIFGTVRLSIPWQQAMQGNYDPDGSDSQRYLLLAALSVGEGTPTTQGRHVGFCCPDMYFIGKRPAVNPWNGLQHMDLNFAIRENQADQTNDLTKSAVRYFFS